MMIAELQHPTNLLGKMHYLEALFMDDLLVSDLKRDMTFTYNVFNVSTSRVEYSARFRI